MCGELGDFIGGIFCILLLFDNQGEADSDVSAVLLLLFDTHGEAAFALSSLLAGEQQFLDLQGFSEICLLSFIESSHLATALTRTKGSIPLRPSFSVHQLRWDCCCGVW